MTKKSKLYRYPTDEDITLLQHRINVDENQRSRATYNFLNSVEDTELKKWWTIMTFPLLRTRERERLFTKS